MAPVEVTVLVQLRNGNLNRAAGVLFPARCIAPGDCELRPAISKSSTDATSQPPRFLNSLGQTLNNQSMQMAGPC